MFKKRQDEMGKVFLPYCIAGFVIAAVLVILGDHRLWPLVFVGWWALFTAGTLVAFILWLFVVSLFMNMKEPVTKNHPRCRKVVLYVLGILCGVGRLRVHLAGEERIPAGRFLLVQNHRSSYDPIATGWALRRHDIAFVTKPENLKIPIAGPWIYQANYLPINREDPRKAMVTIQAASEFIRRDEMSIAIYPEGTRSKTDEMLPFHNGVFKIAQKANVPIVVASIRGTENIHRNVPWRHTDVYVNIAAVLPAEDVKKASGAALGAQVRSILEEELSDRRS